MYEEKPKKSLSLNIDWKALLIKLAILLVVVFILIFIVSLVKKDKKTLESNLSTNLQAMKTAASEYFVGSRLPTNVNGRKKITLGEMFENHLLTEFKDQNNNSCDTIGSFAEATKINSTDYTIKVKLVCGSESDYVINTIKIEDNKIDIPTDDDGNLNQDDNQNTNNDNNSNTNNVVNKPGNSGTTNKPSNGSNGTTNKPGSSNNNTIANNTCTYGNKDYTSSYPLAYIIPGNCAVSKNDFYKAEYANKVSSISSSEYIKLSNEAVSLKNKTGVNVYVENPIYYGIYNKSGKGLVGYQVLFTMKQKVNYATSTIYQYYLDSNGNRTVVIDKRSSVGSNNGNNNNNNSSSIVRVTSVTLNRTSVYLDVNDTYYLTATINPSNATNKKISWKSSNTSVATISSSGKITALREGVTIITATVDGKSASTKVYVDNNVVSVLKITLNKSYLDLDINETYTLRATITPSNATYKNVTWKSSNTSVATVNSKGEVTARKGGTAIITATADGISVSCTIYVNSVIPVSNIVINKSSLDLEVGDTYTLKATVYPTNATNRNVTWNSSNTSVATISSSGKVTAKNAGRTLISATADGFTTSIWVYVVNNSSSAGNYCKKKVQTDYFINVEEKNKYSSNNYTLEYYDKNMKNAKVINAGYVYDSQYDSIRSYFNNPQVTMVASLSYLDYLPYNYQKSALKRENFDYNITQTYQKNGHWYIDVYYKVKNYNNVYSRVSNYSGKNIYYVPLFFQIEYIDLDDCISAREYSTVSKPWNYVQI
jgi:uncharacterized protein YjdB